MDFCFFLLFLYYLYTQNIKFGTVINRKYPHAICVRFSKMRISEFDPQLISSCKFPSTTFQNTNKFSWQSNRESPTVQPLTPEPDASQLLSYFFSVRSHDWQKCCTGIHVFWNRRRVRGAVAIQSSEGELPNGFFLTRLWDSGELCQPQFPSLLLLVAYTCK